MLLIRAYGAVWYSKLLPGIAILYGRPQRYGCHCAPLLQKMHGYQDTQASPVSPSERMHRASEPLRVPRPLFHILPFPRKKPITRGRWRARSRGSWPGLRCLGNEAPAASLSLWNLAWLPVFRVGEVE